MKNQGFGNNIVTNSSEWMPCPKYETEYPGLAYFCPLDELIVAQVSDVLHEVIGEKGVGYTIFNKKGQKVFLAVQEIFGKKFNIKVFNLYGNEIIQVRRPFCLFLNRVLVWAPPGNFVGSVKEDLSCINTFLVRNRSGNVVLRIRARASCHLVYDVQDRKEDVGVVMKEWQMTPLFDVKNFGISFPVNMDVEYKAVLLGACFLIGCLKY